MTTPRQQLTEAAHGLEVCRIHWPTYRRSLTLLLSDGYPTQSEGPSGGISDPTPNAALANQHWAHIASDVDATVAELARLVAHLDLSMRRIPTPGLDLTREKKRARCTGYGTREATCDELVVAKGLCHACYQAKRRAEQTSASV